MHSEGITIKNRYTFRDRKPSGCQISVFADELQSKVHDKKNVVEKSGLLGSDRLYWSNIFGDGCISKKRSLAVKHFFEKWGESLKLKGQAGRLDFIIALYLSVWRINQNM